MRDGVAGVLQCPRFQGNDCIRMGPFPNEGSLFDCGNGELPDLPTPDLSLWIGGRKGEERDSAMLRDRVR